MIDGKQPSLEGIVNLAYKNISLTDDDKANLKLLEAAEVTFDEEIKPLEVALETFDEYGGTRVIGTLGNFSVITGKPKSRKTFFISTALAAALGDTELLGRIRGCLTNDKRDIILFDTEMTRQHVQLLLHRICKQIGVEKPDNLKVYSLRKYSPSKRTELIETRLKVSKNLGFVAIDGIRDLIQNINDAGESMDLISNLMRWTEEYHIHIMTVLHQNKTDGNLRGHIGTEAINKAETVIEIEKNDEVSMVTSKAARDMDIDPFVFGIDENELPYAVDNQHSSLETFTKKSKAKKKPEEGLDEQTRFKLLNLAFEGVDCHNYKSFWKAIQTEYLKIMKVKLTDANSKAMHTYYKNRGEILQQGTGSDWYLNDNVGLQV